jgi:copper homeostasis protein
MDNTSYTFEVCASNLASAQNAARAGAQRIELCSALDQGGITPSAGLLAAAARIPHLQVCVLIRPREGDFCYSGDEIDLMCRDIIYCKTMGAQGVVLGALTPDNDLDKDAMQALLAASQGMDAVMHRAFDFVRDPWGALDWLMAKGLRRVLSSGQCADALTGSPMLRDMVHYVGTRMEIMPGAGVRADNIAEIAAQTGAKNFHFTAKSKHFDTKSTIPGLEQSYWVSRETDILAVMEALQKRQL